MSTSRRQTHSRRTSASSEDSPIEPPKEKFRSACDACAASKVRCTKEQPVCQRCARLDTECVYGLSQRRGKPPMNREKEHSLGGPILPDSDATATSVDRLTIPIGVGWVHGLDSETSYSPSTTGPISTDSWGGLQAGGQILSPPYIASPGLQQPTGAYGAESQMYNLGNASFTQFTTPSSYSLPGAPSSTLPYSNTNLGTCIRESLETLALLYSPPQSSTPISILAPMVASVQTPQTTDFTYPSLEIVRVCINSLDRLALCSCTDCLGDRSRLFLLMTIASKINNRLQDEYAGLAARVPGMQNYGVPAPIYTPRQWAGTNVIPTFNTQAGAFQSPPPSSLILPSQSGNHTPLAQNLLFTLRGLATACGRLSSCVQGMNEQTASRLLQTFSELLRESITQMKTSLESLVAAGQ